MTKSIEKILARYRVTDGKGFRLKDYDPGDTAGLSLDKEEATAVLQNGVGRLAELQSRLYAQDRWAVLLMLQGMDAAGKDGVVKHVFSGVNPLGCEVHPFKAPVGLERDHDFLWRHVMAMPPRGHIGIHNRSWYEEVLVARVHPEVLAGQKLPRSLVGRHIWDERLEDIAAFERYLARQGVLPVKIFLNLSKEEQRTRFLARIDEPEKNWKFSAADVIERRSWKQYRQAYEAAIAATATRHSPWYVVPADHKWFTRLVVSAAIIETLDGLDLRYPEVSEAERQALQAARQELLEADATE
ncbi:polyphosphate kinase 2 family protein [Roseomonas sp. NAR14]|uniref:Polyphosphate kinase 2 family protein n=1 Tax=Roseomonas acroporae TaxID=2937791 RepID=A0A9X2BYY1_9PROT|nr:PPK2 family polyphosphate kinase [Roseomonas acroporae]MCK8787469.1 polyphosphate kinase 2 family protein [Roseomonas acroporae]